MPLGAGWWLASDGRWYPPETHPDVQQPLPAPPAAADVAPGWWQASDGRWYPPESRPAAAAEQAMATTHHVSTAPSPSASTQSAVPGATDAPVPAVTALVLGASPAGTDTPPLAPFTGPAPAAGGPVPPVVDPFDGFEAPRRRAPTNRGALLDSNLSQTDRPRYPGALPPFRPGASGSGSPSGAATAPGLEPTTVLNTSPTAGYVQQSVWTVSASGSAPAAPLSDAPATDDPMPDVPPFRTVVPPTAAPPVGPTGLVPERPAMPPPTAPPLVLPPPVPSASPWTPAPAAAQVPPSWAVPATSWAAPVAPAEVWQPSTSWDHAHTVSAKRGLMSRSTRQAVRSRFDPRGLFSCVASLVVLVASLLPWYVLRVIGTAGVTANPLNEVFHFTLTSNAFGGWRVFIPIVAGATAVVGLTSSILRSGDPGAVAVSMTLRVLTLLELGLVVAALVMRTPTHPLHLNLPLSVETVIEVGAGAWVALAAAVLAAGGAMASTGRSRPQGAG